MAYEIQGDRITNSAGTAGPSFPFGVTPSSTAVPAGAVGSVVSATPNAGPGPAYAGSATEFLVASLPLPAAGTWNICASLNGFVGGMGVGAAVELGLVIKNDTDSTTLLVGFDDQTSSLNVSVAQTGEAYSKQIFTTIAGPKTIGVYIRMDVIAGTPTGAQFNTRTENLPYPTIYAICVG